MPVVVGVDGAPGSYAAIRLALQEAHFRNSPLIAVMAFAGDSTIGGTPARPARTLNTAEQRRITEATLRQVVRDAVGEDAAAGVDIRVIQGMPGHALVQAAREEGAQMVVLAARGDGAVSRLLGSVSQFVLRNAPCPVLVVPAES
jgi:nucleotide-binding universal stress UspA family protein